MLRNKAIFLTKLLLSSFFAKFLSIFYTVRFKEQHLQHSSIVTILKWYPRSNKKKPCLILLHIMKKIGQRAFGIRLFILVNNFLAPIKFPTSQHISSVKKTYQIDFFE